MKKAAPEASAAKLPTEGCNGVAAEARPRPEPLARAEGLSGRMGCVRLPARDGSKFDELDAAVLGFAGGGGIGGDGLGRAFAVGLQAGGVDAECFDEGVFDGGSAFLREGEILGGVAIAVGMADDLYVHGGIVFQD